MKIYQKMTPVMSAARNEILYGNSPLIWITGPAGTGKTFLMNSMRNTFEFENTIFVAFTGIASLVLKGETIHHFFKMPVMPYYKKRPVPDYKKRQLFPKLRLIKRIVIDEISMVRVDLFEEIDYLMQQANDNELPFGGVKIVLVGDIFQLSPFAKDWITRKYLSEKYNSLFFFSSDTFKTSIEKLKIFELDKVFRQEDIQFQNLLSKCRKGIVTNEDLKYINDSCVVNSEDDVPENTIKLIADNRGVAFINHREYGKLPGESVSLEAKIQGNFFNYLNSMEPVQFPAPRGISIKPDTQVLLIANDSGKRYVNGTIAKVIRYDFNRNVIILKDDNGIFEVEPYTWTEIEHEIQNGIITEKIIASYTQFPITYGWATTIHRSQGRTLDKVYIDLSSGVFAPGQAYVALSRVKSKDGLYLKAKMHSEDFYNSKICENFIAYCRQNGKFYEPHNTSQTEQFAC